MELWQAGLDSQDVSRGAHEAIGRPSLDLVPERRELPVHGDCGNKGVRAIAEDGKQEGGGKPVAEEVGEGNPRKGESFDGHEGSLGFGQCFDEVGGSGDPGYEPIAQQPDLTLGREDRPIQVDRKIGDGAPITVRTCVDKHRFGNREPDAQPGPSGLRPGVLRLQDLDVLPRGGGGHGQPEVVHVGERQAQGDIGVKAGDINDKQKRGDWGALGRAHRHRGEQFGRSLE